MNENSSSNNFVSDDLIQNNDEKDYTILINRLKEIGKIISLLEKKIVLPAYDQCLKASHIFNLLYSRGFFVFS